MTRLTIDAQAMTRPDAGTHPAVAAAEPAPRSGAPGTSERPSRQRRPVTAAQPRPWSVRQHGRPWQGAAIRRGRR